MRHLNGFIFYRFQPLVKTEWLYNQFTSAGVIINASLCAASVPVFEMTNHHDN